ncbi:hypothetical protein [Cupriavidus sp. CP313]
MHKKTRNILVSLYRSSYVRKGANGNTHGYSTQEFVGSLPVDSQEIPPLLAKKLSADERLYVERVVIEPAKRAVEARHRKEEERERDPGWRIDEALRLLSEASDRIGDGGGVATADSLARLPQLVASIADSVGLSKAGAGDSNVDPLKDALAALERATQAVRDGRYDSAPAVGVQATEVYRSWSAIMGAVEGSEKNSLLRALQERGWVKVRRAASR